MHGNFPGPLLADKRVLSGFMDNLLESGRPCFEVGRVFFIFAIWALRVTEGSPGNSLCASAEYISLKINGFLPKLEVIICKIMWFYPFFHLFRGKTKVFHIVETGIKHNIFVLEEVLLTEWTSLSCLIRTQQYFFPVYKDHR